MHERLFALPKLQRSIPFWPCLFAAFMLMPAEARAAGELGMEEAVRLALAQSERARKAPLRVEAAQGQLTRARAAFLPSLSADGSGTLSSNADRTGRMLGASGSLTLHQSLLNLPAIPLYAQSRHQLENGSE